MNNVSLIGRLTQDVECRQADSGNMFASFTLAVSRPYSKNRKEMADFIHCIAFNKTAEFIANYFHRGDRIGITGKIETGSYTNAEGQKVYTVDVIANTAEFAEGQKGKADTPPTGKTLTKDDFVYVPDDIGLPFD